MRAFALALALCGCEKAAPTPAPSPDPVPVPVTPADAATLSNQTACDVIVVLVARHGVWVGAPPDLQCYAPRVNGKLDFPWLEGELRGLKAKLDRDCTPAGEVGAEHDVGYQELITTMDITLAAGVLDIGISEPDALAVKFRPGAPGHCPAPPPVGPHRLDLPQPLPAPAKPPLAAAPVIIVTKTAVKIGTTEVPIAQLLAGSGPVPELAAALARDKGGLAILQADESTDVRVINRIVVTAKQSGHDNLVFAVKQP